MCYEQQSLPLLLTVADVSVLEGRRVARKELLGGTKKLKKLFVRKKWPIRPGLQISHQLNFVRSNLKHVRRQPQKLNCLRKGPGRNSEKGWTMISKRQTKCFGRPFAVWVKKDLKPLSSSKDQMASLGKIKMRF